MLEQYRIDPQATIGLIRNYDPLKQVYLFTPNINHNRPIAIPQEYIHLIDIDNPASSETEHASLDFTMKTPFSTPNITINSFNFTTKDFISEIFEL